MKSKKNRRVLLIGGAGYIGPVITDYLLSAGYYVNCLDNFLYQNNLSILSYLHHPNYKFFFGDFRNLNDLNTALIDVTDVVILAGLVGDPITKKYPQISKSINDIGIVQCISNLDRKKLNQVIFISTCSNYGLIKPDQFADEDFELTPLSLYAKSKVEAERYLLNKKSNWNFTPTVLRFATAFGLSPRMRFDLTVNEFTRELAMGRELLIFDADTWRPYCHVKDFARLVRIVLETAPEKISYEVFNAGGDANNFTKQGIVNLIMRHIPNAKVCYEERGADLRNYRVDFTKVRNVLNFEPIYSVENGVLELLSAIKQHVFDQADLMKNFHGNYEVNINSK